VEWERFITEFLFAKQYVVDITEEETYHQLIAKLPPFMVHG